LVIITSSQILNVQLNPESVEGRYFFTFNFQSQLLKNSLFIFEKQKRSVVAIQKMIVTIATTISLFGVSISAFSSKQLMAKPTTF